MLEVPADLLLRESERASLNRAIEMYERNVHDAADFLAARGISEQAAREFRLGVVREPAVPEHKRFVDMLSIAYLTPAGAVALKFRALDDRTPKYNAPQGQRVRLFNVAALHSDGDTVAICEGELDALVMTTVVGIPAVGIPGASNWQPYWARCFADYENILIVADNDEKEDGGNPGMRHAEKLLKRLPGSRLVVPPMGSDLTEWVQAEGAEAVRDAI